MRSSGATIPAVLQPVPFPMYVYSYYTATQTFNHHTLLLHPLDFFLGQCVCFCKVNRGCFDRLGGVRCVFKQCRRAARVRALRAGYYGMDVVWGALREIGSLSPEQVRVAE